MRWTCLLALALITGCATQLTPDKQLLQIRNRENRPHLPQPTATRIPVPDGVRSLAFGKRKTVSQPPFPVMASFTNGLYVVHWTPIRWVVQASEGNKIQVAGQAHNGDGQRIPVYDWFTLPDVGTWIAPDERRYITSNIPTGAWLVIRIVPTHSKAAANTTPVPKWFLDLDRKTR